jgi:hypothetical protein
LVRRWCVAFFDVLHQSLVQLLSQRKAKETREDVGIGYPQGGDPFSAQSINFTFVKTSGDGAAYAKQLAVIAGHEAFRHLTKQRTLFVGKLSQDGEAAQPRFAGRQQRGSAACEQGAEGMRPFRCDLLRETIAG